MPVPRFHPLFRLLLCAALVLVAQFTLTGLVSSWLTLFALPVTARIQMLLLGGGGLLGIGIVALCRGFFDKRPLVSLGLRSRRLAADFCSGAFCGAALLGIVLCVLFIAGCLEFNGISATAQKISPAGIARRLTVWAVAILIAASAEEICFRGYALHSLSAWLGADRTGLGAAAILQGALFALVHLSNFGPNPSSEQISSTWQALPNIALIGIFFALCVYKTGSLWFPIGFHAAWNFLQGCVVSLPVSGLRLFHFFDVNIEGPRWLTGGPFGLEGSLLLTALTIALIAVVRREADNPQLLADITMLQPSAEWEPDVEVASRAPRQRLRKEKLQAKIEEKPTFTGWNDMAPQTREPYRPFQPQGIESQPEPDAPLEKSPEPAPISTEELVTFATTPPPPEPVSGLIIPPPASEPKAPEAKPEPTPPDPAPPKTTPETAVPQPVAPRKPSPRW